MKNKNKITDYQDFTTIDTPEEKRRELNVGDIWSNSIKCGFCSDVIRSKNRHNMVYCSCGKTFVDGGSWYRRYGGEGFDKIEFLTEYYNDAKR